MMRDPRLWSHPRALDPQRPVIFLLHGFTGSAAAWDNIVTGLGNTFECVALDLPGHGGNTCENLPEAYSFDGVCDLIAELLDSLPSRSVHFWGYSMGGRIALQFALRHPTRISHLILESSSPGIVEEAERAARLSADQRLAERILKIGVEAFAEEWIAQPLFATQQVMPAACREKARAIRVANTAIGLASALRGFSIGLQAPLHNRLGELKMPVLLAAGELDLKYRVFAKDMARSIPGSQLHIIPGAGHAPHWENPAAIGACVKSFLQAEKPSPTGRVTR